MNITEFRYIALLLSEMFPTADPAVVTLAEAMEGRFPGIRDEMKKFWTIDDEYDIRAMVDEVIGDKYIKKDGDSVIVTVTEESQKEYVETRRKVMIQLREDM